MLAPGEIRDVRPATGGDEDAFATIALPFHLDGMGVQDTRVSLQQGHPAVDQQRPVDTVQPADLVVLAGDQGIPVETWHLGIPAIAARLAEFVAKGSAVDEILLGHAAHVDAGATEVAAFRYRHPGTEVGGETRRAHSTRTGAYHEEVEIIGRHGALSLLLLAPA